MDIWLNDAHMKRISTFNFSVNYNFFIDIRNSTQHNTLPTDKTRFILTGSTLIKSNGIETKKCIEKYMGIV